MTNSQPAQDTELFDLCKAVYEATGWDDNGADLMDTFKDGTPIYDSDYLLDKLPHKTYCGTNNVGMGVAWKTGTDFDQTADTPLKSLLKLTLALHKSGELK